ncbi:hypothetical protein KGQ27_00975 [Patescibacteria group bacterium]|nr:hypothetical protein [Patescibacteria group bacterium]MDE1946582.1 hypothetical protein [Patescibacteria group bacterium]MDE2010857.1 hypothetical protein [Patescibacteria group bacterium]MDE2233209.1 hypothetical protein [Patescibacteria group bacterium]
MNKTQKAVLQFDSGDKLLEYLNSNYSRLHKKYEDAFWISYMGDHSVDDSMNTAQKERDSFRADAALKAEVERLIKRSKDETRKRLKIWNRFFSLYQVPPEAVPIKAKIAVLEAKIMQKRSSRKEGYIDHKTGKFVESSENKMRMIMRTDPDESVRKACFVAMEKLPSDTIGDYIKVVKLRNQFARVQGFNDFYEYKARIDEDMTKNELFKIFDDIYKKTKYGFKNIRAIEKSKPGLRKPWNFAYMMAGDFVKEEDQYFRFENVLDYWGRSFAALGIDFKGGKVTLDLLDRKGKWNNGFCHYPDLVNYKNGKRLPGSSNFASNAIPKQVGSGIQGIHTVFHEGGHAADRLNSFQKDVCINTEYPPSTVSWAETQSMFLDAIPDSIEWRVRYAKNADGIAYPFELYERKLRALFPLRPLELMSMCFVVNFEKEIYECPNLTKTFVIKTAKNNFKKYFDRSEDSVWALNVPHIYNFESSAYYHGYGLAELGIHQWRDYFFDRYGYIVDNPKVGEEMSKIWSYASLYSAKKLIKMATSKKLSPDSFIRHVTMPLDEVLALAKTRVRKLDKVPVYRKPVNLKGKIIMVDGKNKIADNSKSFEDMESKYRKWLNWHS